jgi:hypothetical protein
MSERITNRIDYENSAERWWRAVRGNMRPSACPASCWPLLAGQSHPDKVTVSAEDADAFREWAETLPGWSDGPENARHPFTFNPAED